MKEGSTSSGSPSTSSWLEVDNPQPVGLHGDTNQAVTVQGSVHVVLYWLVMSPWSVDDVDLHERLQRRALGMVTNMRGRTSAARPVETRMINLSVRVKWGIRRFMTGKYQADRDREPLYTDVNSSLWMNNITSWTLSWPSKNVLKTWRLGALG